MVFVTVGNATQGFKRLLSAVDEAAGAGVFGDESILIQTGNNPDFQASHCEQQPFLTMPRFEALIRSSSLIISHGGAGALINVLRAGKVPVVMPRRRHYSEHVDDHQFELVQELAREGRVIPVFESSDLPAGVVEARQRNARPRPNTTPEMLKLVAQAIADLTELK